MQLMKQKGQLTRNAEQRSHVERIVTATSESRPGAARRAPRLIVATLVLAAAAMMSAMASYACVQVSEPLEHMELNIDIALSGGDLDQQLEIAWLPPSIVRYRQLFLSAAKRHGVDPEILAIVALVESGGWSQAKSRSGARGLMQIMPATGAVIAEQRGLEDHNADKLYEPEYNIDFGAWYLARQLESFPADDDAESVELAAAAYNGGPTRLRRHLAKEADLSDETSRYKRWVKTMWQDRQRGASNAYRAWLDAGGHRLVAKGEAEMEPPASQPSTP